MRFSALVAGGLAALATAAPVVVTRTAVKIVTVHRPRPGSEATSNPVPRIVVVTKAATVTATAPAIVFASPSRQGTSSAVAHQPAVATHEIQAPSQSSAYSAPTPDTGGGNGVGSDCADLHAEDPQLCQDSLDAHNRHRRNHTVLDMKWSKELFQSANYVASQCNFTHLMDYNGGGYGQNLEIGSPAGEIQRVITNGWYNSEVGFWPDSYYGQATPPDMLNPSSTTWERYGHFTQVVWAASDEVGCAQAFCARLGCSSFMDDCDNGYLPDGKYGNYLNVCNYKSPGNFKGAFDTNVIRPPRHVDTYVAV